MTTGRPWGRHLIVDLFGCDRETILSEAAIRKFTEQLVDLVGMTAYGPPWVARFAEHDPLLVGITAIQPITTSDVVVHAIEASNAACVDLFSCQSFDDVAATAFMVAYFHAGEYRAQVIDRGPTL